MIWPPIRMSNERKPKHLYEARPEERRRWGRLRKEWEQYIRDYKKQRNRIYNTQENCLFQEMGIWPDFERQPEEGEKRYFKIEINWKLY
jgi:hypothetical protein